MSVYAFSDIHGNYGLFCQIKNFLKPDDICYVLGDVIDRGTEGYRILKEILADTRFKMLRGNHEDMFIKTSKDVLNKDFDDWFSEAKDLWYMNGGQPTYRAWKFDNFNIDIIKYLKSLPLHFQYKNYYMSHSGYYVDPQSSISKELMHRLLWDRGHIYSTKPNTPDDIIIIHGHTPTRDRVPIFYNNNGTLKIDIDCGTALTHKIYLFNLDTQEYQIFE